VPRAAYYLAGLAAVACWSPMSAQPRAESPQVIFNRAVADFESGRIVDSVRGFDQLAALQPQLAPQLWQRGIALYFAARYKDCRAQFESHRTVNPADVENAAWHFACAAKADTPEVARAALLPVGPDPRRPMREIYQLLRGEASPEQVLAAAQGDVDAQFYAHLYLGLYFDALGDRRRALEHLRLAADDRYAQSGGYMHVVARVHLDSLGGRR
jgi:lipoprotein NlpI